ncbi:hypothetical protein EC396_09360 [Lutibacter sp. HS1-25]|uniref:hypothetical protein n=1 Tax=Lutibacter sp. HS1-25 TaxID=2485000 RepID=UPI001011AD0D|nr:hypothetical protein [Lutibacter sp. HS1-25]RXP54262.1 hypothetical protein EC396_09360 [Lutibacter sp. HS1-25]
MKLNKQQIQKIEDYLNDKKIDYLDIRFEVLDHILTDIENLMDEVSFDEAFEKVKLKWNENLSPTFSFLLCPIYFRPSIFIDRCKKIYKPHYKNGNRLMILYVVIFALLKKFVFNNSDMVVESLNYFIVATSFVYVCIISYWYFLIKKTKQKTTFSFLFNTQVSPTILVLILVVTNIINESFLEFGTFYAIFLFMLFMTFYQGFNFYKNHIVTIEKYQLQ